MKNTKYRTPGQLIKVLLEERGWTQKLLSIILDVDVTAVNHLIGDKRPVNAEMSIALSEVFNIPAETFLTLQKEYDLAKARITVRPDPIRATRAYLLGDLPIAEMIKRGWLSDVDNIRNISKVEDALMKFFNVNTINEIETLPHAAKKTNTSTEVTPTQMAWIYRVKEIANEMIVARYSPSALRHAITLLNPLMSASESTRKVPRILMDCGIRYIIVESLSSAKIDGVCFWLNDFSPVIGMSLRYDRIDNFWFVLRHEIEHVLRRHGQGQTVMLDSELEGEKAGFSDNISEEERTANEAAANFCVPQKTIDSFIARKSPFFNERDILGLARTLQIHPGLVAGQLQYRTGRYDRFRQHLAKVRSEVVPNAMHDGWGDVAPVGL